MKEINIHNKNFQRGFGYIGVLLQVGLTVSDYAEPDGISLSPVYFGVAFLFWATAVFASLGPLQAALFYGMSAIETVSSENCIDGLAFAAVAAIILFRRGWFFRKALIKSIIVLGVGWIFIVVPVFAIHKPFALVSAIISAATYSVLVIGLAKGRFLSALAQKPQKPSLVLASYHLTKSEIMAVKNRMQGKSVKEIAYEHGKAESTIRNALANACRKLQIGGREDLLALAERFRIE